MTDSFMGYRRADGRVGVRNHVLILSTVALSNPLARRITSAVAGAILISNPFGRGQSGEDLATTERTCAGLATHPNVASVLLVGYDKQSVEAFASKVREARPEHRAETLAIETCDGTIAATARGIRIATELVIEASRLRREPASLADLFVAIECGGSDPSSGLAANPAVGAAVDEMVRVGGRAVASEIVEFIGTEHILARRAASPEVGEAVLRTILGSEERALRRGVDIRASNPVPENIAAGLTTLEEKSLGAVAKVGHTPIVGVMRYAERPTVPGVYIMDTPFFSPESMTAMVAAGAQLVLFTTGVGNPMGSKIAPTLKVTGHPEAATRVWEHVDVDVSAVIAAKETVEEAGTRILAAILDVASGTLTKCEVLGEEEISVSRFAESI